MLPVLHAEVSVQSVSCLKNFTAVGAGISHGIVDMFGLNVVTHVSRF